MRCRPVSPEGVIEELFEIENFKEMLNFSAEKFGDKPAFSAVTKKGTCTDTSYRVFKDQVEYLGTALTALGLKGEKIAVISENRYEWCLSYMAVTCGVGVIVPLDRELPDTEIVNLLNKSGATAVFFSAELVDKFKSISKFIPELRYQICMDSIDGVEDKTSDLLSIPSLLERGKKLIEEGNVMYINEKVDSDALGVLIFTSGTTSFAKGVMLSQRNIVENVLCVVQTIYIDERDSVMSILPLHHTYEATCGFLVMFYSGCKISFCPGIRYISKTLKVVKPSILILVPLIIENLHKKICLKAGEGFAGTLKLKLAMGIASLVQKASNYDISDKLFSAIKDSFGGRMRLIITGAAAIEPRITKDMESFGIAIRQGYGMTETSPIITVNTMGNNSYSSAGLPLPDIELKIDNPDENGIGEILTKSKCVMLGYYRDEEATKEMFTDDGWMRTGDLGYCDKKGYLYITGRNKSVIVTKNGKNVFPEELESALNKSPLILESLVFGEKHSNGSTITDVKIKAQLVLDDDVILQKFGTKDLPNDELDQLLQKEISLINRQISSYKNIVGYYIRIEPFEKTTTQKIKRFSPSNLDASKYQSLSDAKL